MGFFENSFAVGGTEVEAFISQGGATAQSNGGGAGHHARLELR